MSKTELIVIIVAVVVAARIHFHFKKPKPIEFVPELVMSLDQEDMYILPDKEEVKNTVALPVAELRKFFAENCTKLDSLEDTGKYLLIYNCKVVSCRICPFDGKGSDNAIEISKKNAPEAGWQLYRIPPEYSEFTWHMMCSEDGKSM